MKRNIDNILKMFVLLSALLSATCIFALQPPKMQCLKLLNNNQRIKIAWSNSADCSSFKIYYFYINGALVDSLSGYSGTQTYTLCDYSTKEVNNIQQSAQYSCYIVAYDSNDVAFVSDTINSISLTVTPSANNTLAFLSWESPSTILDNSWGTTFDIFKKRDFDLDFPTVPFASVPNSVLEYVDTSDVCEAVVNYQVSIKNYYGNNESCPFMTTIGTVLLSDSTSPTAPVLDSVTVTATNEVMLGFHETEPHMMAYVIYYSTPDGYKPLDTVFNANFWIDPGFDPSQFQRKYSIAVLDSCGNCSAMVGDNNRQSNFLLSLNATDPCLKTASLSWTNYENLPGGIGNYQILLSNDLGQSWQVVDNVQNTGFVLGDLELNTDYFVFVRAVNNDGSISASSNRVNIVISADESSDFSYIRSVSVVDNEYVRINVLTSGDTLPFVSVTLQKSDDNVNFSDFRTISYQQNVADYTFFDSVADFSRKVYYYRTYLLNNCGNAVAMSDVAHNILLQVENLTQNNLLSWNQYDNWNGDVDEYLILRQTENDEIFNAISHEMPSTLNSYTDDVSMLYEAGSKFSYCIEAKENTNEFGFSETSFSNRVVAVQNPTLYIPNAFRPSGADNNVFKPVNSFVSSEGYKMIIYNRSGECIFLTTNPQEGWTGTVNGQILPLGVYVYLIQYKLPDGTKMEQTGTVTLVR